MVGAGWTLAFAALAVAGAGNVLSENREEPADEKGDKEGGQ